MVKLVLLFCFFFLAKSWYKRAILGLCLINFKSNNGKKNVGYCCAADAFSKPKSITIANMFNTAEEITTNKKHRKSSLLVGTLSKKISLNAAYSTNKLYYCLLSLIHLDKYLIAKDRSCSAINSKIHFKIVVFKLICHDKVPWGIKNFNSFCLWWLL